MVGRAKLVAVLLTCGVAVLAFSGSLRDSFASGADGYALRGAVAEINGTGAFTIYGRFNRPLRRYRRSDGRLRPSAKFLLAGEEGFSGLSPTRVGREGAHCYLQDLDFKTSNLPAELRKPVAGQKVRVAVRIRGVKRAVRGVAVLIRPERRAEARLGC
jgi:hypothetical protein